MKNEISIEQLLHWRLMQAEGDAPRPPRAGRLLEMARPWWEKWPERFQLMAERLRGLEVAYGHAMTEPRQSRTGHPVPVVIMQGGKEVEGSACLLYFSVREGRLRLRFRLEGASEALEAAEVTFVCDKKAGPLFSAPAVLAVDSEYRMDAELPENIAREWAPLKVTDRMPFHLILRAEG